VNHSKHLFGPSDTRSRLSNGLRIASGVTGFDLGLFIVYQIGFVGGLFTNRPHWNGR
jgi:hypothetical protein